VDDELSDDAAGAVELSLVDGVLLAALVFASAAERESVR